MMPSPSEVNSCSSKVNEILRGVAMGQGREKRAAADRAVEVRMGPTGARCHRAQAPVAQCVSVSDTLTFCLSHGT